MASIRGTSGDDVLVGTDEKDVFNGGSGNDTMSGGAGNDVFFSGGGDDIVNGEEGNDTLRGDGGNDTLDGGVGDDTLVGGSGSDTLFGGTGENTLTGDSGGDRVVKVFADAGVDTFDGGTGLDVVELVFRSEEIAPDVLSDLQTLNDFLQQNLADAGGNVDVLSATATGASLNVPGLGLTVSNVEQVFVNIDGVVTELGEYLGDVDGPGGGGPTPPDGFDALIEGTSDDDDLTGTDGRDFIEAGTGNDFVEAGLSADEIHAGDGDDRVFAGSGDDVVHGEDGDDVLVGDAGNDQLIGGLGDDIFFGGGDDDQLFGEIGNDTLNGDGGDDVLNGGAGSNILNGGAGDDTLIHALGSVDTMVGGIGVDTLVLDIAATDLTDEIRDELGQLVEFLEQNLASVDGDETQLAAQSAGPVLELAALGVSVSAVERVEINIDGVVIDPKEFLNRAPELDAVVSVRVDEDGAFAGSVDATDADNDVLVYTIGEAAQNGAVVLDETTGSYVYRPAVNFSGADRFTVVVSDPDGASVTQTIDVVVDAVADAPVLNVLDATVELGDATPIVGTNRRDVIYGDQENAAAEIPIDIAAALVDVDGSETLEILVSGLPADVTLSAGVINGDGTVSLAQDQLDGLTIATNGSQAFSLDVQATATDGGDVAEMIATLNVNVDATSIYDDVIDGLSGSDTIFGGLGDDILDGGRGNDRLFGGDGDDVLVGGRGRDFLSGGDGIDTVDFSGSSRSVRVDLDRGFASGEGRDRLNSIENVTGSSRNDRLVGDEGTNVIDGGAGRDLIRGGAGEDVLTGGAGRDVFHWQRSDMAVGQFDRITDFDASQDVLDLRQLYYVGRNAPDGSDRVQTTEIDGGTLVSVDMSYLPGSTELVFLEGVTGLNDDDWFVI